MDTKLRTSSVSFGFQLTWQRLSHEKACTCNIFRNYLLYAFLHLFFPVLLDFVTFLLVFILQRLLQNRFKRGVLDCKNFEKDIKNLQEMWNKSFNYDSKINEISVILTNCSWCFASKSFFFFRKSCWAFKYREVIYHS